MSAAPMGEVLPAVSCQPWCVYGDGHPGGRHVEDQWCETVEKQVDLSQHGTIEESAYVAAAGRYVAGPDFLYVWGKASPVEPVCVRLVHDASEVFPFFEVSLTLEEAARLAAALTETVRSMVEQTGTMSADVGLSE